MADGVGESCLLPPEDIVGQDMIVRKCLAQQIFSHIIGVHFQFWADGHDVSDEIQIAERHSCFERVDRNAAVCAQDIVHIQFIDTLLRLLLERFGTGGKVCVLIAEQFIGNFAGHQDTHVRLLMDGLAAQVHAHTGADGRDVIRSEQSDNLFKGIQHLLPRHGDRGVLRANEISGFLRVFEVDRV